MTADAVIGLLLGLIGASIPLVGLTITILTFAYNRNRNHTHAFFSIVQMEQTVQFSKCMDSVRLVGKRYGQMVKTHHAAIEVQQGRIARPPKFTERLRSKLRSFLRREPPLEPYDKEFAIHVYNLFIRNESEETCYRIRTAIDYVNYLQHMRRLDFFNIDDVLLLYNLSLKACYENLWPWWFEGFRAENKGMYYSSAERLIARSRWYTPRKRDKPLARQNLLEASETPTAQP